MLTRGVSAAGLGLCVALLFPSDAYAYLDPGSGSLIFQTIVATLAGVAYGVRLYWSRIRGWFGGAPAADQADGLDTDTGVGDETR